MNFSICQTPILKCGIAFIFGLLVSGCDSSHDTQAFGLLARDRIILTATANEIIESLPVEKGQVVEPGQVLVKLSTLKQEAILARAKAEAAKAEAYLLKLVNGERREDIAFAQAQVRHAQVNLVESKKDYQRVLGLVEQNLAPYAEKDKALAQREAAQADYHSAKEKLDKLISGERPEVIKQAQAALEATEAEVVLQQSILDDLTVVATRKGILDSLPFNVGERVPKNGIVAVIQADTVPFARVYIPESHRIQVKVGDELNVHIDGLEKPLTGNIRWIANEPAFTPYYTLSQSSRSRLMYLSEITLPTTSENLPTGVPVKVDLYE